MIDHQTGRRRSASVVALAAGVMLLLAACGGSATSENSSEAPPASSAASAAASVQASEAPAPDQKKAKAAYIDGSCTNSWRVQVRAEFEYAASQDPQIESAQYTCAQGDLNQAISAIQSSVAQGYSPIVVFSDFGDALLPAIRDAHSKGAVVVPWLVDIGGTPGTDYSAFVGDDLTALGIATADWLNEALGGKGNWVGIEGPAGNAYDIGLDAAIKAHLAEVAPDIKWLETVYADWDPAKSAQAASALLSKYDNIDAVVADEGSTLPGIITRWQAAGRPLPAIYSNDLNSNMELYNSLKPANPTLQYGYRGARTFGSAQALQTAMKIFNGETPTPGDLLVQNVSFDCAKDCATMYKSDMPGSYIPTSKVPAEILKPLLEAK
jgi:ribose transport system substrate-binding protein